MQCHYQVIVQNNDSNLIKEIVKIHILQPEADQYMILPYTNMYKIKNIYTLHNKKKKKIKIIKKNKGLEILIILANMEYRTTNCLSDYDKIFVGDKGESQVLD